MKKRINITRKCILLTAACGWFSISQAQQMSCVARNDCGVEGAQPYLIKGENYTLPEKFTGSKEALTCNFGGTVIYAFNQMDINAAYQLEVVYLADSEREQRIVADGNEVQAPVVLQAGKEQRTAGPRIRSLERAERLGFGSESIYEQFPEDCSIRRR